MISVETSVFLAALVAVALAWLLPARIAIDGVALWTCAVMALLSWETTIWLATATVGTTAILNFGDRVSRRGEIAALWAAVLVGTFVYAQLAMTITFIGSAYFTLRLLHVVAEWWLGRIDPPSFRVHWRYQFFLPVFVVGPIHRLPNFQRQIERRRWDAAEFVTGAERALAGFFLAAVLGEYGMLRVKLWVLSAFHANAFALSWTLSALDWIALYFVFAGLSGAAIGISLMAGLRLEENFNHPWRASSLVDFWTRWHMTLTSWCRDYVFVPVMALSRSPLAGLICAMLVVGLWHRLSLYYVLWGFWQTAGVVLNRSATRIKLIKAMPRRVMRAAAPLLILGWLSLARPMLGLLLGATS